MTKKTVMGQRKPMTNLQISEAVDGLYVSLIGRYGLTNSKKILGELSKRIRAEYKRRRQLAGEKRSL